MRTGSKVLVAAPAAPALRNHQPVARSLEVVHQFTRLLVVECGAHRHLERDRIAIKP